MRQGPGAKLIVYLITLLNGKCGGAGKNFIIIFITGSDLLTTSLKLSLTLHQKDLILVKIHIQSTKAWLCHPLKIIKKLFSSWITILLIFLKTNSISLILWRNHSSPPKSSISLYIHYDNFPEKITKIHTNKQ